MKKLFKLYNVLLDVVALLVAFCMMIGYVVWHLFATKEKTDPANEVECADCTRKAQSGEIERGHFCETCRFTYFGNGIFDRQARRQK